MYPALLPKDDVLLPRLYRHDPKRHEAWLKVMYFDPKPIYDRLGDKLDVFSRHQKINMADMWPSPEGRLCACGCGLPLPGRQKRWATEECSIVANKIFEIIYGRLESIYGFLEAYYGNHCAHCIEGKTDLQVDHIIGVKHGGGGCWLTNYQLLCPVCHRAKTRKDFGWGEFSAKEAPEPKQPMDPNQLTFL